MSKKLDDKNSAPKGDVVAAEPESMSRFEKALNEIMVGDGLRTGLSILLGFVVGAIFMVVFNPEVDYAFSNSPGDILSAIGNTIGAGYGALFQGAIFNPSAGDFVGMITPLTQTLQLSAPLILAGLGVGLGFRLGLFNIGAGGQIMMGLGGAIWVSTRMSMPPVIHMLVAVLAAMVFAAVWGAIVGFLKARTGANEVIVTIMLNYVALYLLTFMLREPYLLLAQGSPGTPKSDAPAATATLPKLLGDQFSLNLGFVFALIGVLVFWLLIERSTIGFRYRMIGLNDSAARSAGINVERTYIAAMAVSAAFAGLAAANQALGLGDGITPSVEAGIGFDAITVALLGGSRAGGILMAGLLFGAFEAGKPAMQFNGVSPEVLGVIQAFIVLFIAAPPLIRAIFRLPSPTEKQLAAKAAAAEAKRLASNARLKSLFSRKGAN